MAKQMNSSDAEHSIHRFVFTSRFTVLMAVVWLVLVMTTMLMLPLSLGYLLLISAGLLVAAFVYHRAVRDRAREWMFSDRQYNVPVLTNWLHVPFNKESIDRVRHVLTAEETEILLITRRSVWKPLTPTLAFIAALVVFLYTIGLSYTTQSTEIIEKRVGPRGNKRVKEVEVVTPSTTDLTLIVVIVVLIACVALVLAWLTWFYTFFVKTNLFTYPHLTLPPVLLPFLDNNEESYSNNRIGKVDNVNSTIGQMLRFGGVKFVLDLTGKEEPRVMTFMPKPRQIVIIMREGINASQRINPSSA